MKKLLDLNGIEARVEITDGSLENLEKLKERFNQLKQERETRGVGAVMAILQSDIANAASWEQEEAKYEKHFSEKFRLRGLRRIASLHEENLHIFARRTWIIESGRSEFLDLNVRDLDELWETARVSVGPENGGSRLTAEALLDHLGVPTENRFTLSLADMVERMLEGELDIGFFISSVPGTVIGSILDSDAVVMLGLDPPSRSAIRGPGFEVSKIGKTEYASQAGSKHDIESIKTRAVLVMLENTPAKVFEITRVVVEGAKYLKLSDEEMVKELESVSLHEEAKRYYQEANLLPRRGMLFRELLSYILNGTWKFLAIVVITLGGFKGAIEVKRQNVKRALLQRVQNAFKLPHPRSLEVLAEIRKDAFRRVPLPWWALSELDWGRWAAVRDVIDEYKK